jgi:hypothetical protein
MSPLNIIHSNQQINISKYIDYLLKGEKYFKYYNHYLIPYQCQSVNHNNRLIIGNFVYPMWNTIEKAILSHNIDFKYNYVRGKDFTIEYNPRRLNDYHISGKMNIFPNKIRAYSNTLQPNSILLFPIHKKIAQPLIDNQLL